MLDASFESGIHLRLDVVRSSHDSSVENEYHVLHQIENEISFYYVYNNFMFHKETAMELDVN